MVRSEKLSLGHYPDCRVSVCRANRRSTGVFGPYSLGYWRL